MRKGLLYSITATLTWTAILRAQPPGLPGHQTAAAANVNLPGPASQPAPPGAGQETPPAADPACCVCEEVPACPGRVWASGDYLLWWTKDSRYPPLVTAGAPASRGILGREGTQTLFGGDQTDNEERSGGRFTVGWWLDDGQTLGLEGGYLFLGSRTPTFTAGGDGRPGSPVVSRPFFNVLTNQPDVELVSFPGVLAGTVTVAASSRLQGAELNAIARVVEHCGLKVDVLAGFRYLQLDEGLGITENLQVNPTIPLVGGSRFVVADQFAAHSRFYGGQLGARAEFRRDRLFVAALGKVALGSTNEVIGTDGATALTPPGGPTTVRPGGLLGLPSNSGHFGRDELAVVPEVGVTVGWQVTRGLRASIGYTFLYCSDVVRPGDQIDLRVDPRQLPRGAGPVGAGSQPAVLLKDTDFWAQGINFGLEWRF